MPTRVLVVEDNATNRYLLCYLLETAGFEVMEALDGCGALEQARLRRPDLILMDLRMPVMDGWQCTRELKADPALSSVPVIAVSADTQPADVQRAIDAGCTGHIGKPVDLGGFVDTLRRLVPGLTD